MASRIDDWEPVSLKYGKDHELQRLTVWHKPAPSPFLDDISRLWVIYIHGGAWRDPKITDTSFSPTIAQLATKSNPTYNTYIEKHVAAFASIDYRLSAHPNHPQDKDTTPPSQYRNAKHPDHINDIVSAISFLQEKYGFGHRYMLVGHSCGATLAFQTVMKDVIPSHPKIISPKAIVGVAGIYDLRLLRETNSHPEYNRFLTDAFGEDVNLWDKVSPAKYNGYQAWNDGGGSLIALASSKDDELIDDPQIDSMSGLKNVIREILMKRGLEGSHDDIWEKGVQLAKVVEWVLKDFFE